MFINYSFSIDAGSFYSSITSEVGIIISDNLTRKARERNCSNIRDRSRNHYLEFIAAIFLFFSLKSQSGLKKPGQVLLITTQSVTDTFCDVAHTVCPQTKGLSDTSDIGNTLATTTSRMFHTTAAIVPSKNTSPPPRINTNCLRHLTDLSHVKVD